ARHRGEGARLLHPVHRRARRHGRPLGRDAERGRELGQGRPRPPARHRRLLLRLDHRAPAAHRLRARQPSPAEAEAALRAARCAHGGAPPRVPRGAQLRPRRRLEAAPMTAFARERELAERAAREAGAIVRRWYERGVGVVEKAPDNPVTRADLEANACIRALLASAFPDDGWLSEETADSTERLRKRRVWVVDPLDGTQVFIHHIPEFCICILLVEEAGGRVTHLEGAALRFNQAKTLRPGMIAFNGVLHAGLLALIAEWGARAG